MPSTATGYAGLLHMRSHSALDAAITRTWESAVDHASYCKRRCTRPRPVAGRTHAVVIVAQVIPAEVTLDAPRAIYVTRDPVNFVPYGSSCGEIESPMTRHRNRPDAIAVVMNMLYVTGCR